MINVQSDEILKSSNFQNFQMNLLLFSPVHTTLLYWVYFLLQL